MEPALALARRAGRSGEVPVGAVVVRGGRVIGRGGNRPIRGCDPTAHAELLALRAAARRLGNYRLTGCDLFVTLEPCLMCVGAMVHARIRRLVFGAPDPKVGAAGLVAALSARGALNHRIEAVGGVRLADCRGLLAGYFRERRARPRRAATAREGASFSRARPARPRRDGGARRTAG